MNPIIFIFSGLLLLAQPLSADDLPIMVVESGSREVDALVAQLVSRRPHPFPPSGPITDQFRKENRMSPLLGKYITKEVAEAIVKLERLGPAASPYLLSHLGDERYSYSTTLPSMVGDDFSGWIVVTVGDVAREVITGGFESCWLYKCRAGPNHVDFPSPQFHDYLEAQGGLNQWVAANSKKSKAEVFNQFIDWSIAIEKARGFPTRDDEKQLLKRYNMRKLKVEQDGAGQNATR